MNLLEDPWLHYRFSDGTEKCLPITAICNPEVVDFALPRADFQGAAYQFAIGLLQTAFAPEDDRQWHEYFQQVLTEQELLKAFDQVKHAFQLLGDGPLFMQDRDDLVSAKPAPISGLLIEAPGENTLKQNTDHFIKRGIAECLSLEMAALALFTLQINAPSGGQGHRVGLRGGGPLTTLVMPSEEHSSLWQKLWLNIIDREQWPYDPPDLNSAKVFPWLESTKASEKKGAEVYQGDVHVLHMYWSMPRRIRLVVDNTARPCDLSAHTRPYTVSSYRTLNYGYNYSGNWEHPLTPYKWNPKKTEDEHLSIKGQPGGIHYKIWSLLTQSQPERGQRAAPVVDNIERLSNDGLEGCSEFPQLWAFGYDMDNMKARGWYARNPGESCSGEVSLASRYSINLGR